MIKIRQRYILIELRKLKNKRLNALLLIGSTGMEVASSSGKTKKATENNLPISSYLSHGSRVKIEIPPGSKDELINWLTTGNKEIDGRAHNNKEKKNGKIVYNRSAATHSVSFVNKEGVIEVVEKKTSVIGEAFRAVGSLIKETKHWGVDLAMNAEFGGKDSEGHVVNKPDGDHGHLYLYYEPPKDDQPGALLIGIEGGAPSSSKHSILGKSDPLSPVDGSKFENLTSKQEIAAENEYKDILVPKKFNGMSIKLDNEKLSQITKVDSTKYGQELATMMPVDSPDKLIEAKHHEPPEFKKSKPVQVEIKKPSGIKRFINRLTVGLAFKKEINQYKIQKKTLANQNKIRAADDSRLSNQGARQLNNSQAEIEKKNIPMYFLKEAKKIVGLENQNQQTQGDKVQVKKGIPTERQI